MSILKTLFSSDGSTAKSDAELADTKAFDAANAAIDRAIAERQSIEAPADRRVNEPNRRMGGPDNRPSGSLDQRTSPQHGFGRRRSHDR